jgi:hypothetical protein
MDERSDDETRGRVDLVSYLYVIGGVPMLVGFLVVLFGLVNACDRIPA